MGKELLVENYMDPLDPGGYFIINGNERVMVIGTGINQNLQLQVLYEIKDQKGDLVTTIGIIIGLLIVCAIALVIWRLEKKTKKVTTTYKRIYIAPLRGSGNFRRKV